MTTFTADRFVRSGKVRDIGTMADGRMLLTASDRISAFDVVLPTTIPDKGKVLTGLSRFWFRETEAIVPNHLLAARLVDYWRYVETLYERNPAAPRETWPNPHAFDDLQGRIMICQPAMVIPVEAVVRGYLSGSGWKEYRETGSVCGVALPAGLRESDRLPEPIFTPAEKAPAGRHDRNITFDEMIDHISTSQPESLWSGWHGRGPDSAEAIAERIRDVSLQLYRYGAAVAERSGVLLADTKFEFGIPRTISPTPEWAGNRSGSTVHWFGTDEGEKPKSGAEQLILIDEVMTPDSSRFWDAAAYAPGGPQPSFDKQFVRDWLEQQPWDKTDPGPALPDEVVEGTRMRYIEAYERITGASFERYLREDVIAR